MNKLFEKFRARTTILVILNVIVWILSLSPTPNGAKVSIIFNILFILSVAITGITAVPIFRPIIVEAREEKQDTEI